MRRLAAASLAIAALLAAHARAEGAPAPSSFDYLYIRAHEGNASGGHAAIRFGADTFDFQHRDGWLVPRREGSRRFQHTYRTLQNRGIEVSRVGATPETISLLRETFARRVLAQSRQLEVLDEMARDVALLDALAAGEAARLPVRGAGFFADAGASAEVPAVLTELRARIAARHGAEWLAGRRGAALRTLRELARTPLEMRALRVDPLVYPIAPDSLSRRAGQALAARAACEVILRPRTLREGVRAGEAMLPDGWLALDRQRRARLLEVRAALLDAAVEIAASRRPDWGEALLLAGARLVALDESLESGHLVVLDAFPSDATILRIGSRRRALLPTLLDEARRDFVRAHRLVFERRGFREASWSELEEAVTRIAELRAAQAGASQLRVTVGTPMLPEGIASLPVSPRPAASRTELASMSEVARDAERRVRGAIEAQYRYDLTDRNCVSELFRTIEAGLASVAGAPPAADRDAIGGFVREESRRRLGGYVDPVAAANFIPFVSSRNVRASWRVAERVYLPSAREYAVAREGTLGAALRESNVLTAKFYEPAEGAGFFVFFTDGKWPLRPLLGAANLVAALARSGVGVLQLPVDRGQGLRAGLGGVVWSVPELFFGNIRKGTNEYVPPAQRPPPG